MHFNNVSNKNNTIRISPLVHVSSVKQIHILKCTPIQTDNLRYKNNIPLIGSLQRSSNFEHFMSNVYSTGRNCSRALIESGAARLSDPSEFRISKTLKPCISVANSRPISHYLYPDHAVYTNVCKRPTAKILTLDRAVLKQAFLRCGSEKIICLFKG